jgi:hypothetical protein
MWKLNFPRIPASWSQSKFSIFNEHLSFLVRDLIVDKIKKILFNFLMFTIDISFEMFEFIGKDNPYQSRESIIIIWDLWFMSL